MNACVYLDNNATTPMLTVVWEAMLPYLTDVYGNPASAHQAGRRARKALEDAREQVASLLGAFPDEVIFTSGATEANNLALFGLAPSSPAHILTSPLEHPCVVEPLKQLSARGHTVELLPVEKSGVVRADEVAARLRAQTRLLCVMLVNHETGAVQPVVGLVRQSPASAFFHCDAAQAVGKMAVHFHELGVTTLTLSAHKFHGPKGVGALLLRRGTRLFPLHHGGHQQHGRRPGTEPVALAVGLAAALTHACRHLDQHRTHVQLLHDHFLREIAQETTVVNGSGTGLPYTLNLSFPGLRADVLLMNLDLAGVACSTGSACSSGSLLPSPVLQAMGVAEDALLSALRFSFSPLLTREEIQEAARRVVRVVQRLRGKAGGE